MNNHEDDLSIAMREMEETKEAVLNTEITPEPWLYRGKSDAVYTKSATHPYGSLIFRFHEEDSPNVADLSLILVAPELLEALNDLLDDVGRASSLRGAVKARAALSRVMMGHL